MSKKAIPKNAPTSKRQPFVYRDFNLRFAHYNQKDGTYKVWVEQETPGGTMRPEDAIPCTYDSKVFWKDPILGTGGLLGKLDGRSLPKKDLFQLGRLLTDLALPEQKVRPLFEKSLTALKEGEGLRIRLRIGAPELAELPWEFMMLPQASGEPRDPDFLVLRREISIVRTDTVEAASRKSPNGISRVVGVLSCPGDQEKLNVNKDKKALEKAVKDFNQAAEEELIKVIWVEKPATQAKLEEALGDGADIFQYSGHATFELHQQGKLCLEKNKKESELYDAAQLAQLLHSAGVRLAVLSACETGRRNGRMVWSGIAPALTREKIPAVIANQFDIGDKNATLFASRLYLHLLSGYTVDEALFEARQAIYQKSGLEKRDWGVPVLYLHDETGVLFPPKPETPGSPQIPDILGTWKNKWYIEDRLYTKDTFKIERWLGNSRFEGTGHEKKGPYRLSGEIDVSRIVVGTYKDTCYPTLGYIGTFILELSVNGKVMEGCWHGRTAKGKIEGGRVVCRRR